jgi:CO/xanthine dehydrogenase Mo-binding subunit
METPYRFIGKSTPRKDAQDIVRGKAQYIDDVKRPGMLHGKVLRSPFPHAKILKIDTAEAEALPGVKAVLTHENVPDWKTGIPRHVKVLDHKVRFVGDAVALVAAETEQRASEALEHIQVLYEQLPAVYDVEEALQPDAPQLYDDFPSNLVPLDVKVFGPKSLSKVVMGDVEQGFAEADFIGEGTYTYENIANPLPLEPPGVIAEWEGPDQLTIRSATQSASWHRFIMLSKMGFPDIRAISTHCGGSFGSKNYSAQPLFYAAALSKATGRPVKVMYNKEEHFGAFCLRLGSRFRGKVGIKRDGTVTAVSGEWLVDTGAFSDMAQAQVAVGCGEAQLMLRCANWNLQTKLVLTNRCASGVVRGFGGQELESAFHPILSIAMERANLDPVDFFRKNYVKPGEGYFWRDGNWWVCRGKDYSQRPHGRGRGIWMEREMEGMAGSHRGSGPQENRGGDGCSRQCGRRRRRVRSLCSTEPGCDGHHPRVRFRVRNGARSSLCKMAAEVLQLPLDRVSMTEPDSLVNPFRFRPGRFKGNLRGGFGGDWGR